MFAWLECRSITSFSLFLESLILIGRESALQSGVYIPTNHFFAEQSEKLKPFHSYSYDKSSKGFILMPRVEADDFEDPDSGDKGG